jgi:hypothetical protein
MMHGKQTILIVILLIVGGSQTIPAAELTINGYYKNFSVGYDAPHYHGLAASDQEPMTGMVTNRIRCNLSYQVTDCLSLNISYALIPRIQDRSFAETSAIGETARFPTYRLTDFNSRIYPAPGDDLGCFGVYHNLDRALVTVSSPQADWYLGRQAIAWGSARAINPTDFLAPFAFDELDTEDRRGVDAIRIRKPLGMMSELDIGYVFGDNFAFDQSAFFLRGKSYIARTDISLIVAGFREHLMAGGDVTRAVGGASVWLEAAQVFTDFLTTKDYIKVGPLRYTDDDYFRVSIGVDHALSGTIYAFIEYHYSQAGTGDPHEYHNRITQPAFTDGAVYLWGEHYLIPGLNWQITPLITGGVQSLINLTDPSVLLTPQIEYNVAEVMYIAAGGYIGVGSSPQIIKTYDGDTSVRYRSEFGAYADMYFTSFRVYF